MRDYPGACTAPRAITAVNAMALIGSALKMKPSLIDASLCGFVPEASVTIRQVANGDSSDRSVALQNFGGWDSSHGAHLCPGGGVRTGMELSLIHI